MRSLCQFVATVLFVGAITSSVGFAQSKYGRITGQVVNAEGKPEDGVTITITELNKSTSSNDNGYYSFSRIKPGNYTLSLSCLGTSPQQKSIEVSEGFTTKINFTLTLASSNLNDVVVSSGRTVNHLPVTAAKAAIRPFDLPQSTGVVTSRVITDQQINRLGDAVRNVSGVSLTQTRGGVAETFTARGYSVGVNGASGSIFKNGVLTNTTGFPEASTLESIEVLKGSAALLYGNVSGGLVINMVTKKPKFESGGEVSMRYGSYNIYKPTVDVYGPVSKNLALRLIGTYENSNSYRNDVSTRRTYINPSMLYILGKNTTMLLEGEYLKADLTPDNGIGTINTGREIPVGISRAQFINMPWAYHHLNQYTGTFTLNHQLSSNWHLNFIGSAQSSQNNSYGSSLPNNVASNGDWNRGLARANTTENNYTAQVNLNGEVFTGNIKHQLLVGTDMAKVVNLSHAYQVDGKNISSYIYDRINIIDLNKYASIRNDIPLATDTALTRAPVYRNGYYVQDLISLTSKLKVLAGLRWTRQNTEQSYITNYLQNTNSRGSASKFDKAFTPKAAIIYQPAKTTSMYLSYSSNFIVNSGIDIYTNAAIAPSYVKQYEAGIKNELFNGKVAANFSVYRIINSNLSVTAPYLADGSANSSTTFKILSGQTTSDGFEVDVQGALSKNIYFITGYSFNNARYTQTSGLFGSYTEGERLVNNPKHTVNATAFYTFSNSSLKGLKVGASAFYTGIRYGGYNNTMGQSQKFSRLIPLSSFTTVNISAGYTYKKVSVLAQVSNITNELNYLVHDNYSITPIAPRQFLTTLAYKF